MLCTGDRPDLLGFYGGIDMFCTGHRGPDLLLFNGGIHTRYGLH